MATQVQTVTDSAQEKTSNVASGAQDKVQGYTNTVLSSIDGIFASIRSWAMSILDRFFPPEQRAAFLAKIQEFMLSNPKLSAFLGMNIFITGVPLALFILFTLTVLIFSLLVGIILGLLAAVLFTLFCVGVALTIVLPFIFFTTATACFLFLWGLGGYYILKWANNRGDVADEKPLLGSGSVGDSLNNLTGGRLTGFLNDAKKKADISGFSDENTKPAPPKEKQKGDQQQANGTPQQPQKAQKQSVGFNSVPAPRETDKAARATTDAPTAIKKSADATNTVKGALGFTSGLSPQ